MQSSQWLFDSWHALRSIWTVTSRSCLHKRDAPLKRPWADSFFSLCVARAGFEALISLGHDGGEKSYTLKTHRAHAWCLCSPCGPLFLLCAGEQWRCRRRIGCTQIQWQTVAGAELICEEVFLHDKHPPPNPLAASPTQEKTHVWLGITKSNQL